MSETVAPKFKVGDVIRTVRSGEGRWRIDYVDMIDRVYRYTCIIDNVGKPSTYQALISFQIAEDSNAFVLVGAGIRPPKPEVRNPFRAPRRAMEL